MPGNYLGTLLDHVNSCRTRLEGAEGGREEEEEEEEGCREEMEMGTHKRERGDNNKTPKHKQTICICLPALFSCERFK